MAKLNKDRIQRQAEKYIRSGNNKKAVEEYEKWISANPKDWNMIRLAADLYARMGQRDEAIKKYTQIAQYYQNDGFNVRAIATYKMILRLDTHNERAMASLADLQVAQGLLMEAKSQYQTLVELYTKSGQKKAAKEVFKKLAELDPSDLKVRYKYAEFLDRQGQAEEAILEYVGIADEFINNGLVPEAMQIMEKGLRIDSFNRSLRCKLAQASVLQGDYAKAIQLLSEIRGKYPDDLELLTRLGEAYMGAGSLKEAEAAFGRLAELDPDNPEHTSRRAELAMGQADFDKALELVTPLVERFVSSSDGDKASSFLQKILNKDPHHIKTLVKLAETHTVLKNEQARLSAYDQLCEAYTQHGNYEKAVDVAERLIDLEPENSQHKDRLRFLKSRLGEAVTPREAPSVSPAATPGAPSEPSADIELPGLESLDVAEGLGEELPAPEVLERASPGPAVDLESEPIHTLSSEDEEHVKEKLTEAEVFVRYGLVDKAVDQLKDVLQSFRFHVGAREKLIEVYKDQGMNREAGQELVELARVHQRLGDEEASEQLLREARSLGSDVEAVRPATDAEEEIELTLTPEEDLSASGLETDFIAEPGGGVLQEEMPHVPDSASFAGVSSAASAETQAPVDFPEEVELSLDATDDLQIDVDLDSGVEAPPTGSAPAAADEGHEALEELPEFIDEEIPVETDVPVESEVSVEGDISIEDEISMDDELSADEPMFVEEDVSVEVEEESQPEAVVEEEFDLEEEPASALEEPALETEAVDEEALDLELPLAEAADESEEISLELPEMPSASSAPELEIPEMPPAEPVMQEAGISEETAPQPAPITSSDSVLSAELQEVDEYIALGLYEDARDSLRDLLAENPDNPDIPAKIEELGFSVEQLKKEAEGAVLGEETPVTPAPLELDELPAVSEVVGADEDSQLQEEPSGLTGGPDVLDKEPEPLESVLTSTSKATSEPFVDLASALSEEMFGTQSAVSEDQVGGESPAAMSDPGLDEIFREFKKGVEKQLGTEDYDTRYNLGIAYKEMGLLDEAIAEFQLAAKDEARLLECCSMLGLCFMEKGMPEIAIKWFEKGLAASGRNEEEYHGLRYDLAQAHEASGNPETALELYMEIYRVNARFRDVKERVRDLQAAKN